MKDLPMFMTEAGAASLIFREIPYQGAAYVKIQDSRDPQLLLEDCVAVCRAAGAEKVYASGDPICENYPLYTRILRMQCDTQMLGDTDAALFPVQEATLETWRRLYNSKVTRIPNGAWMTEADGDQMLRAGEGYFVHRGDTLLGIGRVEGNVLRFVASVQPGVGADVVRALCHAVTADTVVLEVASTNQKAITLYDKLGFITVSEVSSWYCVL